MKRLRPLLFPILLTFAALAPLPAPAQTVYRIGVEQINYYPIYEDDHGEYIGYARALLDAFAKSQGIAFQYVPLPVARLFSSFLDKNSLLDFKFPDHEDWQAQQKIGRHIVYSVPLLHYVDGVMMRPEQRGKGLAKLHVLGILLGFTPVKYEAEIAAGRMRLAQFPNFSGLLLQALMGRIDGAYMNVAVGRYQTDNILRAPGRLVFDPTLPHVGGGYKLSTIKHPELIEKLDAFMRDHADEVNALQRKYQVAVEPD
jgi:ABC-type amino acid transport substrate-binding protein